MPATGSKEACPRCREGGRDRSGDNLIIYDNGAHCFACGYSTRGEQVENPIQSEDIHDYVLSKRSIGAKVCTAWDTGVNLTSNNIVLHYKDNLGNVIAQKVRTPDKQWFINGVGRTLPLYGQWLWEPNPKLGIVITEGELDALAIAEAQENKWPVVSVPNGAAGAKASIQRNLQWLQGFRCVTLAFDNDDVGKAATAECVHLFEPGTVKVADWGDVKDANDCLKKHGSAGVSQVLLRARTYRPDKIITVSDIRERILEKPVVGVSWPWPTMTELTRGVRMKELTVLMGPASVGKTTLSLECVHHMAFTNDMKCGIMSFEQSAEETYQVLCGMQLNKNLLDPGVAWEHEELEAPLAKLDNTVYACDDLSPKTFDDVKVWLRYLAIAMGCKFILIDNLSNIAVTFDRDEQRGIQKAMVNLFDMARILDVHILLMTHVTDHNKTTKTHEEGKPLRASDARGSDSIAQHCTAMFGAERNAVSPDPQERNILTMRCLKMRKIGPSRGQTFRLQYVPQSGRLIPFTEFEGII